MHGDYEAPQRFRSHSELQLAKRRHIAAIHDVDNGALSPPPNRHEPRDGGKPYFSLDNPHSPLTYLPNKRKEREFNTMLEKFPAELQHYSQKAFSMLKNYHAIPHGQRDKSASNGQVPFDIVRWANENNPRIPQVDLSFSPHRRDRRTSPRDYDAPRHSRSARERSGSRGTLRPEAVAQLHRNAREAAKAAKLSEVELEKHNKLLTKMPPATAAPQAPDTTKAYSGMDVGHVPYSVTSTSSLARVDDGSFTTTARQPAPLGAIQYVSTYPPYQPPQTQRQDPRREERGTSYEKVLEMMGPRSPERRPRSTGRPQGKYDPSVYYASPLRSPRGGKAAPKSPPRKKQDFYYFSSNVKPPVVQQYPQDIPRRAPSPREAQQTREAPPQHSRIESPLWRKRVATQVQPPSPHSASPTRMQAPPKPALPRGSIIPVQASMDTDIDEDSFPPAANPRRAAGAPQDLTLIDIAYGSQPLNISVVPMGKENHFQSQITPLPVGKETRFQCEVGEMEEADTAESLAAEVADETLWKILLQNKLHRLAALQSQVDGMLCKD